MKLRFTIRDMPCNPSSNRNLPSNTLHTKCRSSLLILRTYFTRRKLRMASTKPTCQRRLSIFRLYLPSYRTRYLLRFLSPNRNMERRYYFIYPHHGNSFPRLCSSMRTNKILRSNSNHKTVLSCSIHRTNICRMTLRRICSR
jgi:hypothetical protein